MTTQIERSAAHEMVEAGQGQITEIEQAIATLDRQIEQAQTELAYTAQSREAQDGQVLQARLQAQQLEDEYDKAHSYALLAAGTANERRAISQCSAAKRAMDAANKALEKLCRQVEEAERTASEREQELEGLLRQWHTERAARCDELSGVYKGMRRAKSELGAEVFEQAEAQYHKMAARILEMKTALLAEQVALQEQFTQAVEALQEWPDLQKDFLLLEPPNDSTWHMIEGTLQYMDLLAANITTANIGGWPSPWDMRHVLFVPERELYTPNLQDERRRRLEQTRAAYLEHWRDSLTSPISERCP